MRAPALAGLTVVRAATDDELLDLATVRHEVDADAQPGLENMRHTLATFPHAVYLLARLGDEAVGCAYAGCFPGSEHDPFMYAHVGVTAASRRQGVGGALLAVVSSHAQSARKEGLTVEVKEDDPDSLAWVERRGFVEIERQKALELELASAPAHAVSPPPGVSIVPRSAEHERGMYVVGAEAGNLVGERGQGVCTRLPGRIRHSPPS